MGKIVALDYGRARIGIAISDENKKIAFPHKKVLFDKSLSKTALKIFQLLEPDLSHIESIVLGYPLLLNGQKGEMAKEVDLFAEELKKYFSLPIHFWDERLSSAMVERMMRDELNLSRKKRSQFSDELAAQSILQNFLDSLIQ